MCLKELVVTRLNPKKSTAQSRLVRCRISGEVRDIRYQAARYTETSVVANLSFPLLLSFPRGRHCEGMGLGGHITSSVPSTFNVRVADDSPDPIFRRDWKLVRASADSGLKGP